MHCLLIILNEVHVPNTEDVKTYTYRFHIIYASYKIYLLFYSDILKQIVV